MEERSKPVSASRVETTHLVRPADLNHSDRLFGGVLMSWIDEVAGLVARRHAQMTVTTAAVDNLSFLHPAYVKDTVVLTGKATYVGNTSVEVKVDTYVEKITGERTLINRAYITMVGLDENDKPARLPRLIPETEEERADWEKAELRRSIRKQQKAEGFRFYD
ncbi:MAG: acyl-CoA thioesterase [Clostridia bacterium]|nr:acyl-CoA thioesterase [Clostridia bacterium]